MDENEVWEEIVLKEDENSDRARERQQKRDIEDFKEITIKRQRIYEKIRKRLTIRGKGEIKLTDEMKKSMEGFAEEGIKIEVGLENTDALEATMGDLRVMEERISKKIETIEGFKGFKESTDKMAEVIKQNYQAATNRDLIEMEERIIKKINKAQVDIANAILKELGGLYEKNI